MRWRRSLIGVFSVAGVLFGLNVLGYIMVAFIGDQQADNPLVVPAGIAWMLLGGFLLHRMFRPVYDELTGGLRLVRGVIKEETHHGQATTQQERKP